MEKYYIEYREEGVEHIKVDRNYVYSVYIQDYLNEIVIGITPATSSTKFSSTEQSDKETFEKGVKRVIQLCNTMI